MLDEQPIRKGRYEWHTDSNDTSGVLHYFLNLLLRGQVLGDLARGEHETKSSEKGRCYLEIGVVQIRIEANRVHFDTEERNRSDTQTDQRQRRNLVLCRNSDSLRELDGRGWVNWRR
jgi:hypothetical protein